MEPCADDQHKWEPGCWPVHYDGGCHTRHVCKCLDCGWHGVVVRYSNRNSATCALKPDDYAQPLGLAIREHEQIRKECKDLFN